MRKDGRSTDSLRSIEMTPGWKKNGEGSVLVRAGSTVVLCVASVDEGVKDFLRGKGQGWVTAEYLMHPRAGHRRQSRDGFNGKPLGGRSTSKPSVSVPSPSIVTFSNPTAALALPVSPAEWSLWSSPSTTFANEP
jgi:ribonuclease PH